MENGRIRKRLRELSSLGFLSVCPSIALSSLVSSLPSFPPLLIYMNGHPSPNRNRTLLSDRNPLIASSDPRRLRRIDMDFWLHKQERCRHSIESSESLRKQLAAFCNFGWITSEWGKSSASVFCLHFSRPQIIGNQEVITTDNHSVN